MKVEPLIKDKFEQNAEQKTSETFSRMDLFILISLNCLTFQKEAINKTQVSFLQASVVFKELLNMLYIGQDMRNNQKMDIVVRSLINGLYDEQTALPLRLFSFEVKKILIYADDLIQSYFCTKFLQEEKHFFNCNFDQSSFILNQSYIGLLSLCSDIFLKAHKIDNVYSRSVNIDDFEDIASVIVESKHPLLMIFKNQYIENNNDQFSSQIFGAFINLDLNKETHFMRKIQQEQQQNESEQGSLYMGDSNCFLFSLYPKFSIFKSRKSKNSKQCFAYLNNRSFEIQKSDPYGLGFGGDGTGNFRLWIDENLKNESLNKVNNGKNVDQTFQAGYIVEPYIDTLNLTGIEIWSVQL